MILPGCRAMKPTAKIGITRFGGGVRSFGKSQKDRPASVVPSIIKSWKEGRRGGYVVNRTVLARRCSNRTTSVLPKTLYLRSTEPK